MYVHNLQTTFDTTQVVFSLECHGRVWQQLLSSQTIRR